MSTTTETPAETTADEAQSLTEQDLITDEIAETLEQYSDFGVADLSLDPGWTGHRQTTLVSSGSDDPADLLWEAVENARDFVTNALDEWLQVFADKEEGLPYAEKVGMALESISEGVELIRQQAEKIDNALSFTNDLEERPLALSWTGEDDDWGWNDPSAYAEREELASEPTDDFDAANQAVLAQLLGQAPSHREEQEAELAALMGGLSADKITVEAAQTT